MNTFDWIMTVIGCLALIGIIAVHRHNKKVADKLIAEFRQRHLEWLHQFDDPETGD